MLRTVLLRLRSLFRRNTVERELDDELRFHIERQTEAYVKAGLPPEEASRRVRLEFGGVEQVKEEYRDALGWRWLETLWQDVRYGVRGLRRSRGFTVVAVLTLALGIGANTALFSVIHSVLLRPLPYKDPDRLVMVWESNLQLGLPFIYASPPNYADWHAQNTVLEGMAAFRIDDYNVVSGAEAERVYGAQVTSDLLSVLGVQPFLGRSFRPEDDQSGATRVVLLSHGLWRRRYGASPDVLGQKILLGGRPHEVIGILPPGFWFPPPVAIEGTVSTEHAEILTPVQLRIDSSGRSGHNLTVIGRLREGIPLEAAAAEMATIAQRLAQQYPETNTGFEIRVVPLHQQVFGGVRTALLVLLGAVGLLLLLASANVANLILSRTLARAREFGIRTALGASRGRLVRQLLTESGLLAIAGGLVGLGISYWIVQLVVLLGPRTIPRLGEATIDTSVLLFCLGITLLTVFVCGLAPALLTSHARPGATLAGRWIAGHTPHHRMRKALLAAEVAISFTLLVGAGLLLKSFWKLLSVPTGFQVQSVVTMSVQVPWSAYSYSERRAQFFSELRRRAATLPGVRSVGFVDTIPLGSERQGTYFWVEGRPRPGPGEENLTGVCFAGPGYFAAMGIPLRGRGFTEADTVDSTPVVIINETLARRWFGTQDPVGRSLVVARADLEPRRIVGVATDVKHDRLEKDFIPNVYLPYAQYPAVNYVTLAVRGDLAPDSIAAGVRALVRELDPTVPLFDVRSMSQIVSESVAQPRLSALVLALFAFLGLVLTAVGTYGVISYFVSQRFQEIGIRMALGAEPRQIIQMVVEQGLRLMIGGLVVGIPVALLLTHALSSLLFGISPRDAATYVGVVLLTTVVTVLACYIPARRVARMDPMLALRQE